MKEKFQSKVWLRICLGILLFYGVIPSVFALRISDVHFEQFGRTIQVHYTLDRLSYDSYVMLDLYVSTDGGANFVGPLVRVQGDIGRVETEGMKSVIWQAMDEWGSLDGEVVFEIRGDVLKKKSKVENLLMYNVSGSSYFGLMYGIVARWGGYIRGKTDFSFVDAPYTCNTSGVFDYEKAGNYYVVGKESQRSRLGITAGALYRPWPFLYLYAGAGYGFRRLIWHAQTFDYITDKPSGELWAVNTRYSAEGVEAELGLIYRYKRLGISVGINAVDFSFFEVNGAVGIFFLVMDKRDIIAELVRKECEAYRLVELGVLSSVEEGIEMILPLAGLPDDFWGGNPDCFRKWRKELLRLFYARIAYGDFVRREKKNYFFRRFLFAMKKRITGRLQEDWKGTTIDKDLAVPPQTLAFKLSKMLDGELYEKELLFIASACMPSDLEDLCRQSCYSCFPIGKDELFVRLKKDDTEFWDVLYQTVKRLTGLVTSGQYVSIQYRREIIQDTWSDAALFLRKKITEREIPDFESAYHFRNYIARVCLNKMKESIRKNSSSEVLLDIPGGVLDAGFLLLEEDPGYDCRVLTGFMEDIDMENEEEVSRMLTVVLWDKVEPWYSQLTKDIEDKTKLLFLHYVDGLPYDAIAAMQGNGKSEKELKRLENKMRQDAVRTRRLLRQRFMNLLRKNVK